MFGITIIRTKKLERLRGDVRSLKWCINIFIHLNYNEIDSVSYALENNVLNKSVEDILEAVKSVDD